MALSRRVDGQIFFDSDSLTSFEHIFDAVKLSRCVLVIMSGETCCRPWCVGEIVTAHQMKIPMLSVTLDGERGLSDDRWQTLSKEELVGLYGKFEVLRPHGIALDDVAPAIQCLLEGAPIVFDLSSTGVLEEGISYLARFVSGKNTKPLVPKLAISTSTHSTLGDSKEKGKPISHGEVLLLCDHDDCEALAAARTLKMLLQEMLQRDAVLDFSLSPSEFRCFAESRLPSLWIVTAGSLKCAPQLASLAALYRCHGAREVVPLIVGESFPFPGNDFIKQLAQGDGPLQGKTFRGKTLEDFGFAHAGHALSCQDVSMAVENVFKNIAVFVNIAYASESVLRLSVRKLAERVAAAARKAKLQQTAAGGTTSPSTQYIPPRPAQPLAIDPQCAAAEVEPESRSMAAAGTEPKSQWLLDDPNFDASGQVLSEAIGLIATESFNASAGADGLAAEEWGLSAEVLREIGNRYIASVSPDGMASTVRSKRQSPRMTLPPPRPSCEPTLD